MAEAEIQLLKHQLREREEEVQKAAQAGLHLLDQQVELQTQLDEQRIEMTNALEALEQDKYSLQKEVELKTRILDSLQSEFDSWKNQHNQQLREQKENLQRSHNKAHSELQKEVQRLQSALEESTLNERQLSHKLELQIEKLNNKKNELQALNEHAHSFMTAEAMEVQKRVLELESKKVELEKMLQESDYKEEQLNLSCRRLQREIQQITEDKEEKEREGAAWCNALEKSREQNRELQIQLDQALQQAQDPNSRGNSLFGELEDKRAEMEKQLISMKVQYQSLQKSHAFSKQQLQRMKIQIATLMQLQGSRADPAQLERLQSMLSEKNGEIQNLMTKVQRLEKVEMLLKSQPTKPNQEAQGDDQDETYYTDLLKLQLNNALKDVQRHSDELSMQRMKSLSESQRALELERKLFVSERQLKQAQSDKIKLQLRVEELQHKYEPKEAKKNPLQKKRKEKLPLDIKPLLLEETARQNDMAEHKRTDAELENTFKSPAVELNVKINPDKPAMISSPNFVSAEMSTSSSLTVNQRQEEEQQPKSKERKKEGTVNPIHVSSNSSMANQCSQQ